MNSEFNNLFSRDVLSRTYKPNGTSLSRLSCSVAWVSWSPKLPPGSGGRLQCWWHWMSARKRCRRWWTPSWDCSCSRTRRGPRGRSPWKYLLLLWPPGKSDFNLLYLILYNFYLLVFLIVSECDLNYNDRIRYFWESRSDFLLTYFP